MVLDLDRMTVKSTPGSHCQVTYKEKDYWVKELTMLLEHENYELDGNYFVFDEEEYRKLYDEVVWLPELYEYKEDGKKRIWKYSHIEGIVKYKTFDYYEILKYFGKYFLGEIVPYILKRNKKDNRHFFHLDPGFGNFAMTDTGFCLLEPNNWQWVNEDKFNRIIRYACHKIIK